MHERRLGDVASFVNGDRSSNYPSGADFVHSGVPFISAADLTGGSVDWASTKKISTAAYERLSNGKTHIGDLLFSLRGSLGKVARVKEADRAAIASSLVIVRAKEEVLQDYLFYLLAGPVGQRAASLLDNGSVQGNISVRDLKGTPVPLPSLADQRAIVDVLGGLDAKIELNRRVNETLEVMAQAIFRDWFVDFGPVRRKLAGETDPVAIMGGLTPDSTRAAELAAMFPDDLSDDHLPFGWATARVEDLLELTYGKSLPKPARRPGSVPVYGSGGVGGSHDTALVAGPGVIVGRKGTVGSLFWEPEPFFAIDTVFCVLPKPGVSLHFAWQLLHTLGLTEMNTDAAVPGLNRSNVYRLEVPRAPAVVLQAFEDIAGPLRSLMDAKNAETRTLAETRDYLLPRLMSGAVRVSEALEQDAAA